MNPTPSYVQTHNAASWLSNPNAGQGDSFLTATLSSSWDCTSAALFPRLPGSPVETQFRQAVAQFPPRFSPDEISDIITLPDDPLLCLELFSWASDVPTNDILIKNLSAANMRIRTFRLKSGCASHFTTAEAQLLKIGDILREKRVFLNEDVHTYPKPGAIYFSQSLLFRLLVYVGDEITGEVEATQIRENRGRYMAKFKTRCLKAGGLIVIEGDATAVFQSLAVE